MSARTSFGNTIINKLINCRHFDKPEEVARPSGLKRWATKPDSVGLIPATTNGVCQVGHDATIEPTYVVKRLFGCILVQVVK